MLTVRFYTLLRLHVGLNHVELPWAGGTVADALAAAQRLVQRPFLSKLLDERGQLLRGTIILVNGVNILHLDTLATRTGDGDELALFPPGGGG